MGRVAVFVSILTVVSWPLAGRPIVLQSPASQGAPAAGGDDLSRYINMPAAESARTVILVVDGPRIHAATTKDVAAGVGGRGDVFTPEFVTAGLFKKASKGDTTFLKRVAGLGPISSIVLAVRNGGASMEMSIIARTLTQGDTGVMRGDPPDLRGNTTLSVREFDVRGGWRSSSYTILGYGIGLTESTARDSSDGDAVRKLIERLKGKS